MPWVAIFAFPILGLYASLTDLLAVELSPLVVPLSVFLGHRYGRRGLLVAVLGGLLLVPTVTFPNYWGFGSHFDLWLTSIAVCSVAASRQSFVQLLGQASMSHVALATFVVLPVALGIWGISLDGTHLALAVRLDYLTYAFLLIAGIAGVSTYRAVGLLVLVLVVSLALAKLGLPYSAEEFFEVDQVELPLLRLIELRDIFVAYRFNTVTELVTGFAYFVTGRVCRAFFRTSSPPASYKSIGLVGVLALLSSGLVTLEYATAPLHQAFNYLVDLLTPPAVVEAPDTTAAVETQGLESIRVTSIRYIHKGPIATLFPLLGFASAFLLTYRGTLAVLLILAALWTLQSFIAGYFPNLRIPVSEVVVMLGFAALGVALRNQLLGATERWWSTAWAVYVAVVIAVSIKIGIPFFSVYFALFLAIAVAVGLGAERFHSWIHGKQPVSHAGWHALFSLTTVLSLIWSHLGAMKDAVRQLISAATVGPMIHGLDEPWWLIALASMFTLWLLLSALQVLVTRIPECVVDLRRSFSGIKALIRRQPMPAESSGMSRDDRVFRWWHPVRLLKTLRSLVKWVSIAIVVAAAARPTLEFLTEYIEDRNRPESTTISESR